MCFSVFGALVSTSSQFSSRHTRESHSVANLKARDMAIVAALELENKVIYCREVETNCNQKAKELESKIANSKGYRENQLREAELEMKSLKQKADKSRKNWKQREQDYETLNLEILELKKSLEHTRQQIQNTEDVIVKLNEQLENISSGVKSLKGVPFEIRKLRLLPAKPEVIENVLQWRATFECHPVDNGYKVETFRSNMPKPFSRQAKELISNLIDYFEAERDNGGPLIPLAAVRERVSQALLKINVSTVKIRYPRL
ncbi:hypothetical protein NQ315_014227 [Exocentrus adspersus]|uniref:FRIGIDA-like protein n=1 Tax=Exocentrus adspersus TaxID=1586481 RepID=A0AAV8VCJ2_9CUCU|nr:hypothetical protein NQ315_014227 [Exocentrus adspersus]